VLQIILLGTAAGGGFPQWNCWCPTCRAVRLEPEAGRSRLQSSAAVSADGRHWFLLNASPDVRDQLRLLPGEPPPAVRHVPIEGIVLTDGELDHTLGITLLREARHLPLYATAAVATVLDEDSRILPVTRAFAEVPLTELPLCRRTLLRHRDGSPSGLSVEAFPVAGDPPRFARQEQDGHTVGLLVRDDAGKTCAFVPGCGALDEALLDRLAAADVVLFDGTFWSDDELIALGISDKTTRELDHLPVSGPEGSLRGLGALPSRHRIYTHINNTNPMLLDRSPERALVARDGLVVGMDGMRLEV
jgi:pyrroloquinoline quinone biosynthesis protein B